MADIDKLYSDWMSTADLKSGQGEDDGIFGVDSGSDVLSKADGGGRYDWRQINNHDGEVDWRRNAFRAERELDATAILNGSV